MVHGLAGYFDATLFGDVHISILPATHSPGMFSWFPIWFPLRTPVAVAAGAVRRRLSLRSHSLCFAGATIEVQMWRFVDERRMHYEYCLTAPTATPIHNVNARSYFVGL